MRDKIETFSLLGSALGITIISLLDLFGLLNGVPFLSQRIPTMTLLVLGIAVGYIALERRSKLDTIENTLHEIQKHINTEAMRGIEVFSTADELMARMTEITVGAESVSTLNLSPSRGTSPALDRYFTQVHRYIKKHDSQMKSFRTLASLESISKARWILERCVELAGTGRVSTSLLPPAVGSNTFLMGFHIVFKENDPMCFFIDQLIQRD